MSTPRERLEAIASSFTPPKAILKPSPNNREGRFGFTVETVETMQIKDTGDALQGVLVTKNVIYQSWNNDAFRYEISVDVPRLYDTIKRSVISNYDKYSKRCAATKRKTIDFVQRIDLDNKHLANYLIEMYIKIHSDGFERMPITQLQAYFEPLESLRKTYGKR